MNLDWGLTDSHCHLQDPRIGDPGVALARARASGVGRVVCCGTRESDWADVLALTATHPTALPCLGLHPWFVPDAAPGWDARLEALLQQHPAGVGECGLDFAIETPDREGQVAACRIHMRLARRLARPLTLHCRKAWQALAILAREEGLPQPGAVIHAYSGSAEQVRELQGLGFSFGFGCGLANPSNHRARKAVREVAPDRLLLETDAPDLPPRHLPAFAHGQPNEPATVRLAAEAAARARGEDLEALIRRTGENAARLFQPLLRTTLLHSP